jgi:hypothetical protein
MDGDQRRCGFFHFVFFSSGSISSSLLFFFKPVNFFFPCRTGGDGFEEEEIAAIELAA